MQGYIIGLIIIVQPAGHNIKSQMWKMAKFDEEGASWIPRYKQNHQDSFHYIQKEYQQAGLAISAQSSSCEQQWEIIQGGLGQGRMQRGG